MHKIKPEILKEIKKHEKNLKNVWVTPEGYKLKYYKIDNDTGLGIYYNILISKKIEFNRCGRDKEKNICNAISFDILTSYNSTTIKDILDIESVNIWAKNHSDSLPYNRSTVFCKFKDRVLSSEQVEINDQIVNCDYNFSFWYSGKIFGKDTETIKEFTL